jgi:hypothetical protein
MLRSSAVSHLCLFRMTVFKFLLNFKISSWTVGFGILVNYFGSSGYKASYDSYSGMSETEFSIQQYSKL